MSFKSNDTYVAALHTLEDRIDLHPLEPDNVNQTIAQCTIPEGDETSTRSRTSISFANLDQSTLHMEELHSSEKFFSVNDLFSKLMTLQQDSDPDLDPDPDPYPTLSKHTDQSTTIKIDSEKSDDTSSSIKLEPFITTESSPKHGVELTNNTSIPADTIPDSKKPLEAPQEIPQEAPIPMQTKPKQLSFEPYQPVAVITTIEVVQQSAGVQFSNKSHTLSSSKSNVSNKSDLSIISNATGTC